MKRLTYLAACVIGMMMLYASAAVGSPSTGEFDGLVARINKASAAKSQSTYSQQLRKSVNAAAVRHLERTCSQQHPGVGAQTFTLLGIMRLDGVFKSPTPLPDNAFTQCMAKNMDSVNFPLPPGNESGWPVAMQIDGSTGQVLYMAGDGQPALSMYRGPTQWLYTPVPVVSSSLRKDCAVSVWVSIGVEGRVDEVDVADSTCTSALDKAVVDAAHQWLYIDAPGIHRADSMDVRLYFNIGKKRVRVKL